jgi:hypothetical protein
MGGIMKKLIAIGYERIKGASVGFSASYLKNPTLAPFSVRSFSASAT